MSKLSNPDKIHKKPIHGRNYSGDELDVFEASRYFSNNEAYSSYGGGTTFGLKVMDKQTWKGGRISLDIPHHHHHHHHQSHQVIMEKQIKEKKFKQPNSPGGRLASFLNSIFNHQSSSKKKKSKSMKDEEESPGGRRKRRSSISHFRSSSITDSKSMYSSSSSGFRTPPPYANKTVSDQKKVVTLDSRHKIPTWVDEKFEIHNGVCEKINGYVEKNRIRVRKFDNGNDDDDGGESDSSSDLFELQNYDLGYCCSSGLPVYETTNMNNIKRCATISNGPF